MVVARDRRWDGTAVLVTDPALAGEADGDYDRRIDRPSQQTAEALRDALASFARRVVVMSDLGELTDRIGRFADSVVFPYWFGQESRSRHGLVPAICEANGVMFVGADAFTKIVCNDKELSKAVCREAGLAVPASGIARKVDDLRFLAGLKLPVMVKPNYEGTSLGITGRNKCANWDEARAVCDDLLRELRQPVVVEEFVAGREFSSCIMRVDGEPHVRTGSWIVGGRVDYLDDEVFTAAHKTVEDISYIDGVQLPDGTAELMKECFRRLGKVGLMRIDGRLHDDRCTVIELTPDAALGPDSEFAFSYGRGDYPAFVSALVRDCVEWYGAEFPVR